MKTCSRLLGDIIVNNTKPKIFRFSLPFSCNGWSYFQNLFKVQQNITFTLCLEHGLAFPVKNWFLDFVQSTSTLWSTCRGPCTVHIWRYRYTHTPWHIYSPSKISILTLTGSIHHLLCRGRGGDIGFVEMEEANTRIRSFTGKEKEKQPLVNLGQLHEGREGG